MEINGLGQSFNQLLGNAKISQERTDQASFERLLKKVQGNDDDKALKEACRQFESYYLSQIYKQMRSTIPESGLLEAAPGRDIFQSMLDDAYAEESSKGIGTGIAEVMYKQLKRQ